MAGKIMSSKPINPIMSTFLFEIKEGGLHIVAADAAGQIHTSVDCVTDVQDLRICIESKMLIESLKTLPEQPIKITVKGLEVRIDYSGGKFDFMGMDPKVFPALKPFPEKSDISLPCSSFMYGLSKVLFCALDDGELRPIMNTILVETKDGTINYVATDGHLLAVLEQKTDISKNMEFALPKKMAGVLKAIMTDDEGCIVDISVSSKEFVFNTGDYTIFIQAIEGKYPNYRSVIPASNDKILNIETTALKGAVSRVGVFTNPAQKLIRLQLKENQLTLVGQDIDYATNAEEKVICTYSSSPFEIGLKGSNLSEILSSIPSENCRMLFSEPHRAVLISPDENRDGEKLLYLTMPLILN